MVSFPFDNFSLSALTPLIPAYPAKLVTVGDHLRKRRLDLGLWQKQVAERISVTTCTITSWELNRTEPEIGYDPAIIDFLGYVPFEVGESFPERLKAYRMIRGLSQKQLALQFKVDESTLWKWENDMSTPSRKLRTQVNE